MTINTPTGWDEKLKSIMEWLSDEKRDELLEMLKQDKKEREKSTLDSLRWDKDAILNNLKENYVKIEENVDMTPFLCKWKKIHIELPKIWDFEGLKLNLFVSKWYEKKSDFEHRRAESMSYSAKELTDEVLIPLKRYMRELWIEIDTWDVRDCLKVITGLNNRYRLTDKSKDGNSQAACSFGEYSLKWNTEDNSRAKLLLKSSD